MQKIYESQLRQVLDELYKKTVVAVPWNDIYMWFGTQKIAKTPYRHLQKEWEELCEIHQSAWPNRTKAPSLAWVKNAACEQLLIRRTLFKDEEAVDFETLVA
jgi:hypothetical protein